MSDEDEDYEYEEGSDQGADDEEYNYEDGDADEAEEDGDREETKGGGDGVDSPSHKPSATSSSAVKGSSGKKNAHLPPGDNPLIRENSASLELVVPIDAFLIRPLSDIAPLLVALVSEVAALLDITEDEAQTILQHCRWDKERLTDLYFNNPEKVRRECGVDLWTPTLLSRLPNNNKNNTSSTTPATPVVGKFKCRICCDEDCDLSDSFALGCSHPFCLSCYSAYLSNSIADGASCIIPRCPEHKCKQVATKTIVHSMTSEEEGRRFDLFFLRDFIEKSKNMRYCPAPRCERVAVGSGVTTVRCLCGLAFCFKCGEEAHDPASCSQLADWQEKCMNESETANWILANTRKCPNCNTRIEKNQGCNHMTCKICKYEFCWICMGNWHEHGQNTGGFYKCNRYAAAEVTSAAQKAKQELDRYLHYYQRYHGHDQGLKFAAKQREAAEAKMVEQQQTKGASWIDVQFLIQAAEQVIDCRRVLKYTYVLGYFLPDGSPEKKLFEYQQEMLEKNVEKLHEYTEKPVQQLDRTQVVNLTRVTEKFLSSLLQNMTGGIVRLDEASMLAMGSDSANATTTSASSSTAAIPASDGKK